MLYSDKKSIFLQDILKKSWPAIKNNCYKVGSKNPEVDAEDIYQEIYIKFLEELNTQKKISIDFKQNNQIIFLNEKIKDYSSDREINFLQAQKIFLTCKNNTAVEKKIGINNTNVIFNILPSMENKNIFEIYEIGKYNFFVNEPEKHIKKPTINIFNILLSIHRSAKNLSIDLLSKKNIRNRNHDPIVINDKDEVIDYRNSQPEDKIIDEIDDKKKIKLIKDYINKKMESKRSQVMYYYLQGMSYKEIGSLLNISEGNARKIRFKAINELTENFN